MTRPVVMLVSIDEKLDKGAVTKVIDRLIEKKCVIFIDDYSELTIATIKHCEKKEYRWFVVWGAVDVCRYMTTVGRNHSSGYKSSPGRYKAMLEKADAVVRLGRIPAYLHTMIEESKKPYRILKE